jgi:DnaK suppressor protein
MAPRDTDQPPDHARLRKALLDMRAEIVREGDIEIEPVRRDPGDVGGDEDEQPLAEMSQVIASKRNRARTETLGRIDAALLRLETDPELVGMCRECEEPIGKRLLLVPYAELCVACQQARDGAAKPGGRRNLLDFK